MPRIKLLLALGLVLAPTAGLAQAREHRPRLALQEAKHALRPWIDDPKHATITCQRRSPWEMRCAVDEPNVQTDITDNGEPITADFRWSATIVRRTNGRVLVFTPFE